MTAEQQKKTKLPFSYWWPIGIGALVGIALRLIFSASPGQPFNAMAATFIFLAPLACGAVTVYLAERERRRSWGYYATAGALATFWFVTGSLAILIEGLICAIVILPLFMSMGAIGGLLMGLVLRSTRWGGPMVCSIVAAPIILGGIEGNSRPPDSVDSVQRVVRVRATPATLWSNILNAPEIAPDDVPDAWLYRIGVPLPMSGSTKMTADGPIRRVTMGKDIYFDEVITRSDPNRYLRWTYRFYDDSFPRYALDEHVVIGGHYFDVLDTSYSLIPVDKQTRLVIEIKYRVSTPFNWYARPVARFLMGNLADSNLNYYRAQSERSMASTVGR